MYFVVDISPSATVLIGAAAARGASCALDERTVRQQRRIPFGASLTLRDVVATALPRESYANATTDIHTTLAALTVHETLHLVHPPASLPSVPVSALLDGDGTTSTGEEVVHVVLMSWAEAGKIADSIGYHEAERAAVEAVEEVEEGDAADGAAVGEDAEGEEAPQQDDGATAAEAGKSGTSPTAQNGAPFITGTKRPRNEKKGTQRLATVKEIRSVNALIEKRIVPLDGKTSRLLCPVCSLLPAHPVIAPCCASTQCQGCYAPACCAFCGEQRVDSDEVRPHGGRVREVSLLVRELWPLYRDELLEEGLLLSSTTAPALRSPHPSLRPPSLLAPGVSHLPLFDLSPGRSLLAAPTHPSLGGGNFLF